MVAYRGVTPRETLPGSSLVTHREGELNTLNKSKGRNFLKQINPTKIKWTCEPQMLIAISLNWAPVVTHDHA